MNIPITNIKIEIGATAPANIDLLGMKESLCYFLEEHGLNVTVVDIENIVITELGGEND